MGSKEQLLSDLARCDGSGGTQRIHDALVGAGLKYKGPSNSQTLLYYFLFEGAQVGVAAIRGSSPVLSFPAAFWNNHRSSLSMALDRFPSNSRIATDGFVSSSQYSAGQLAITADNIEALLAVVNEVIVAEARAAGA